MNESFIVYIDESGDEGFRFGGPKGGGSSRWFVLSAVVVRARNDHAIVTAMSDIRNTLNKQKNFALHFRELRHEQRVPYVQRLAKLPIRLVNVLIYKPYLKEPETFRDYRLYRYGVRFLLERVSWLCRDNHQKSAGDGSARVVFSNRSSMSYDDLRDYVQKLISSEDPLEVRIEPSVIKPNQIEAKPHHQLAGLQAADAVASSFFFAAEARANGFNEPRYVREIHPVVYRHLREAMGYGIKFWPQESDTQVKYVATMRWVNEIFSKK